MALKTYRPTSPGLRQLVIVDRSDLWKGAPVKMLTQGKSKTGGRNNYGRITTRHIGGGHKQTYRLIDFKRRKHDVPAKVERLEYDPNRTAFIALIKYEDGALSYILAPQRLKVGDTVIPARRLMSSPATRCRCMRCRSEQSSTTSSLSPVVADRLLVPPVPLFNSWGVTLVGRS